MSSDQPTVIIVTHKPTDTVEVFAGEGALRKHASEYENTDADAPDLQDNLEAAMQYQKIANLCEIHGQFAGSTRDFSFTRNRVLQS